MVKSGADFAAVVEEIDIGGPALLRAAAKNHAFVTAVCDPSDYDAVLQSLAANDGGASDTWRRSLAAKVFARTAAYDAAIAAWFQQQAGEEFPPLVTISGRLRHRLRYGENPHQNAAVYSRGLFNEGLSLLDARQIQGKELSYNNLADADAAFELICEFSEQDTAAAVIIKHANPCGAALGETALEAYSKAFACDPTSAFGGIVALNRILDAKAAAAITAIFTEVVLAPDAGDDAKAIFAAKPNLRLLLTGGRAVSERGNHSFRSVNGGFLIQSPDSMVIEPSALRVVTKQAPSEAQKRSLLFAMRVAKHVKSNAIVFAKNGTTLGIGAGQMSRLDSVRIAVLKAQEAALAAGGDPEQALEGSVVASDAFFPFADGILAAADAGAVAVIQPGGSMRDAEVIAAADQRGLAMIFTGTRHFRH
jgi:phosphoribosylaminoimidazolecarboxamide formyltransferase/IMP cyclohydrolase